MRSNFEIVKYINSTDHYSATPRDVQNIIEYVSSQFGETVRLAAKYKILLMLRSMEGEDRKLTEQFLIETLCSSVDSWQQRNLFECIYGVFGSTVKDRLRSVLHSCNIDKLVRMRCLMALGVLA